MVKNIRLENITLKNLSVAMEKIERTVEKF